MGIFDTNFESFGLDIGDRSMKIALVRKRGSAWALASHGSIEVPAGVLEEGIIKNSAELGKRLALLVAAASGSRIRTTYAHVCLPETKTFIKRISVRARSESELPAAIREELVNHIPLPPEELYLDWEVLEKNNEGGPTDVMVGAVPRAISDAYTQFLLGAGIKPVSLQIEAEAILRSILPAKRSLPEALAVVDIGATRSSFICYDKGIIQFSVTLALAGDNLTRLIQNRLNITPEEAEKAKRLFGLDPKEAEGALVDVIMPEIRELVDSIKRNMEYYDEHFENTSPIRTLVLAGGGAYLKGFEELLARELAGVTVYAANPLINVAKNQRAILGGKRKPLSLNFLNTYLAREHVNVPDTLELHDALRYTTAIGLALSNVMN